MYIAPINELRSALDHIFKSIGNAKTKEETLYELNECKEHLNRAGYDALELLVGNLGEQVAKQLNAYRSETLSAVFPEYFKEYKPRMLEIKELIAQLRAEKKNDTDKSFNEYFDQIEELVMINKAVSKVLPSLDEFENKRKKELTEVEIAHQKRFETMENSLKSKIQEMEERQSAEKRTDQIKNIVWGAVVSLVTGIIVYLMTSVYHFF